MKILSSFLLKIIIPIAVCIFFSCKKVVDAGPPKTQLISQTVFKNDASAIAAELSIYSQMEADGLPYNLAVCTGLSSDELVNYSVSPDYAEVFTNNLSTLNSITYNLWTTLYKYIYQANAVLEGISKGTLSSGVKKQLEGEAKFVRAFCHFYLVNLFGDAPVVHSTDYRINAVSQRQPVTMVYQSIIEDLKESKALLGDNYVNALNAVTPDRVRPNKWVATALLARAYLYTGDWVNAEAEATSIISQTGKYFLTPDLNNVFLKNSSEAIWQLMPVLPGFNTIEGGYFILSTTPSLVALNPDLVGSFEPADKRKSWINSVTVGGINYFYPYKYKVPQNASSVTEYSMMFRLSETYLIRAEARAQQNNISGACNDVNQIRNRAGLANTVATSKASLLDAIFRERRFELFTEMGQRWLDIKHMNQTGILASKGFNWRSSSQLYPIPQTEINNNPNLTQNPGY